MFELRWLETSEPIPGSKHLYRKGKVLQYRCFEVATDANGALTLCGSPGWTEWKDVPTQTEGIDG